MRNHIVTNLARNSLSLALPIRIPTGLPDPIPSFGTLSTTPGVEDTAMSISVPRNNEFSTGFSRTLVRQEPMHPHPTQKNSMIF